MTKVQHVPTQTYCWVEEEALSRAVGANGPTDDCIALMPEDWPEWMGEFDDESNIWLAD